MFKYWLCFCLVVGLLNVVLKYIEGGGSLPIQVSQSLNKINFIIVRFQVLMAANMKVTVIWDIMPCSLVETDQHFRGAYCLHHQALTALAITTSETQSISIRLHVATSKNSHLQFFSFVVMDCFTKHFIKR
jgi:hypothetical protein